VAFSTSVFRRHPIWFTDFSGTANAQGPFTGGVILSGTVIGLASTREHPGVVLASSSTSANSGYRCQTNLDTLLLGGGEQFDLVFQSPTVFTNTTLRFGFLDTIDQTDAVDGCYFQLSGSGVIVGKTASNSTRSTTATIATLTASTWYHTRVKLNDAGSQVDFTVFSDAGASLGTANLTTNIPVAAGRETGAGLVATNSGTSIIDLIALDYMSTKFARQLTRGAAT
jgi:hypothetical protein